MPITRHETKIYWQEYTCDSCGEFTETEMYYGQYDARQQLVTIDGWYHNPTTEEVLCPNCLAIPEINPTNREE